MTEPQNPHPAPTEEDLELERLVADWLPVPDFAEAIDVRLREARRLISDRVVLAHRVG